MKLDFSVMHEIKFCGPDWGETLWLHAECVESDGLLDA